MSGGNKAGQPQKAAAAPELDRLTAQVTSNTTVEASAAALLADLATRLRNSSSDPAAINALADQLDASRQALADAIAANTPADPANPTPPAPAPGSAPKQRP